MLRITRELMSRGVGARSQLGEVLAQINLMKSYTTLQGIPISPELGKQIATLASVTEPPTEQPRERRGYLSRLFNPANATSELCWMDASQMVGAMELAFEIHGALSDKVKPATPESIEASTPRKGLARLTWPRITDILIVVTFLAVGAFALGTARNRETADIRWLQLAYLGAALLGACFSQLYTASKFVVDRTFDPASGNRYMTKVVLGAISGMILANFSTYMGGPDGGALKTLAPSALALVGGYSADAVNSILKRFADTVTAAVRGSGEDMVKFSEAQFAAKHAQLEAETRSSNLQARQATLSVLSQIVNGGNGDIKAQLEAVMAALGRGSDLSEGVLDLTNLKNSLGGVTNGKASNGAATGNVPNATDPLKANGTAKTNGTIVSPGAPEGPTSSILTQETAAKTKTPGALIDEASEKEAETDAGASPNVLNLAPAETSPVTPTQGNDSTEPSTKNH